ncbi:MAG TPA: hypothetical protein VF490_05980 [Chryseosolibacter sp.]
MKAKLILGLLLLGGLPLLNSCKDEKDPEPPSPLVGTWTRDVYQLTELPATFSNFEGLKVSSIGDDSYTITFTNDKKYTRKIVFSGAADFNDNGVWTHEGTTLSLDSDVDAANDEEFGVEEDITANALILSEVITFSLLPDAVTDTLTNGWYAAHQQEVDDQYSQDVDVKVLFLFEK